MWPLAGLAQDPVEVIAFATMNPSLCVAVAGHHAANLDALQLPPAAPCVIVQHFAVRLTA